MNRDEFLKILQEGLSDFPEMELNDILYDYREHFDAAIASGKSNEEIIKELGNPYDIVNQYRSGYIQKSSAYDDSTSSASDTSNINKSKSSETTNQIIMLVLIISGLIFLGPIATGLLMSIMGVFIGFLALHFGFFVGGIALLLGTSFTSVLGIFALPPFIAEFPTSVIVLMTIGGFLGLLFNLFLIYYFLKLFILGMKKFINWVAPKIRGEK